jgi:hypothetical protein
MDVKKVARPYKRLKACHSPDMLPHDELAAAHMIHAFELLLNGRIPEHAAERQKEIMEWVQEILLGEMAMGTEGPEVFMAYLVRDTARRILAIRERVQ